MKENVMMALLVTAVALIAIMFFTQPPKDNTSEVASKKQQEQIIKSLDTLKNRFDSLQSARNTTIKGQYEIIQEKAESKKDEVKKDSNVISLIGTFNRKLNTNVTPIDSSAGKIVIPDLQSVIMYSIEAESNKEVIQNKDVDIKNLELQVENRQATVDHYKKFIETLRNNIAALEDNKPAWYDKFLYGSITTLLTILGIVALLM